MLWFLVRLFYGSLNQAVPRANARRAAARLAEERREREEVEAFLAFLSGGREETVSG